MRTLKEQLTDYAIEKMEEFNVDKEYRFHIGYMVKGYHKMLGYEYPDYKFIHINQYLFDLTEQGRFTIDEIKEVILHEIAHALSSESGHGKEWKDKCKLVGCTGKETGSMNCRQRKFANSTELMKLIKNEQ